MANSSFNLLLIACINIKMSQVLPVYFNSVHYAVVTVTTYRKTNIKIVDNHARAHHPYNLPLFLCT